MAESDPGPLLTPDDVAKRLTVSRSMAYTLFKRGEIEVLYVGRLPRVTESALREYMAKIRGAAKPVRPLTPEQKAARCRRRVTGSEASTGAAGL